MLTVLTVLRSGGGYTSEWVDKLKRGVGRGLTIPHRFVCLSDVDVNCERIRLKHDWPGWWSKIEMFRPEVIIGPTLYLDLDTVITGQLDEIATLEYPFAMLRNFHQPDFVGSGVMWFKDAESVPHKVYEKFARMPDAYIAHHDRVKVGSHLGDQAFIFDTLHSMGKEIPHIQDQFHGIMSYKYHCRTYLPPDTSIVCFHGPPRLFEVKNEWVKKYWS